MKTNFCSALSKKEVANCKGHHSDLWFFILATAILNDLTSHTRVQYFFQDKDQVKKKKPKHFQENKLNEYCKQAFRNAWYLGTFYPFDTRTDFTKMKIEFSSLLLCRKETQIFFPHYHFYNNKYSQSGS